MTMLNFNGILYLMFARAATPESQGRATWVLVGLCAIVLALTARTPVRKSLGVPGVLFLCAMFSYLSIGIAVNLWRTTDPVPFVPLLRQAVYVMVVVATAAATPMIARRTGVPRLLQWLLVVLTVGCISILVTPWLVSSIHLRYFGMRNYGFYMQANHAGRFAAMTAWLAFALILCNGNRKLACFALAVAVSAVLASASRAAIVVLGVSAALFVAYWIILRPRITTGAMSLLIFAATLGGFVLLAVRSEMMLIMILALPEKLAAFLDLLSGNTTVITTDIRWDVFWQTLQRIEADPLVGNGFREDHMVVGTRSCGERVNEFIWCSPHNLYLTLWHEAGVVPIAIYLAYVLSTLGTALTLPQRAAAVTALGWTVAKAIQDMLSDNGFHILWLACFSGLTFGLLMHEMHQHRTAGAPPPES